MSAKYADKEYIGFDLCPLFFAFTLDSFSLLAFGKSIDALEQDAPIPFATAFDHHYRGRVHERSNVNCRWHGVLDPLVPENVCVNYAD